MARAMTWTGAVTARAMTWTGAVTKALSESH
jgi:hypothetical protein